MGEHHADSVQKLGVLGVEPGEVARRDVGEAHRCSRSARSGRRTACGTRPSRSWSCRCRGRRSCRSTSARSGLPRSPSRPSGPSFHGRAQEAAGRHRGAAAEPQVGSQAHGDARGDERCPIQHPDGPDQLRDPDPARAMAMTASARRAETPTSRPASGCAPGRRRGRAPKCWPRSAAVPSR